MTKGFLTIAAVLALVLLFTAAAVPEEITVPETEPIIAPELTVWWLCVCGRAGRADAGQLSDFSISEISGESRPAPDALSRSAA